jgi:hypothetical protein
VHGVGAVVELHALGHAVGPPYKHLTN